MKERYSWKEMPDYYHASYFNDFDFYKGRRFVIIDNETGMEWSFPKYKYECGDAKIVVGNSMWNQKFFNFLCRTAIDFCSGIPKEFRNSELTDICRNRYKNVSFESKKKLIINGYMDNIITSDMLEELVDSGVVLKKDEYCNYYKRYTTDSFWRKIPKNIITFTIASKMIEKDSDNIAIIPEDVLTNEMCEKAVRDNNENIANIPLKFQNIKIQKLAIDGGYRVLSIFPLECLSDEIIIYALNKSGLALGCIPKTRRIMPFCELAVTNDVRAIRHVPKENRTTVMCKNAVIVKPDLIKEVPVNILTKQFLMELQEIGVDIPEKHMGYVNECILTNEKMSHVTNLVSSNQTPEINESKVEIPLEFKKVTIDDFKVYFSGAALNQLKKYEITNLKELFEWANLPNFPLYISGSRAFDEIKNTIKLLRCKYLDEDPLIDINDEQMGYDELYRLLGLSFKTSNALKRTLFSENAKEFFEKMRNPIVELELKNIRALGNIGITELFEKTKIVIDHYKLKEKEVIPVDNNIANNEETDPLILELKRLREQIRILENQVDNVIEKIIEEKLNQSKGRV